MTRYLIIILVFIFSTNISYSSDCKTITKYEEYNQSEIILLGYIAERNKEYYTVNVLEVFKGAGIVLESKILGSLEDGLINPNKGETWLLYGSFSEKRLIVSICGYSRSFDKPYAIGGSAIPPPPPSNEISKEIQELISNIHLDRALSELRYDIIDLRNRKLQKELAEFDSKIGDVSSCFKSFLLGLSLLFLTASIYCIFFKKPSRN